MLISQIAQTLNSLIDKTPGPLSKIQSYRTKILGQKFRHNTLFGSGAIHDGEEYGYHHGGRKELQYNIGYIYLENGLKQFYYGIALSFESSREVPDPLTFFTPHTERLNAFISNHPETFDGLSMWHLSGSKEKGTRKVNGPYPVQPIIQPNLLDFYVIGQIVNIPTGPDDPILKKVAEVFNNLIPVYLMVTFDEEDLQIPTDNRLARVCYNTNNWKYPSGPTGKSSYAQSYERKEGFGHEEWLFDLEKVIEGYHYGFLRPVDMFWETYFGRTFDVRLYTRLPEDVYGFVGEIKKLEVVNSSEAETITEIYRKNGWLEEMMDQASRATGKQITALSNLFNVKFKPQDSILYESPIVAKEGEIPFGRYIFYKDGPKYFKSNSNFIPNYPDPASSENESLREIERQLMEQKSVRKDYHSAIQLGLHQYLEDKFPNRTRREAQVLNGNQSIDLKFQHDNGKFILFEIKTYECDLRTCFRAALGQLLEYAYSDGYEKVEQLVIVSYHKCEEGDEAYLRFLRETFNIPLGYMQFDWKTKIISQSIFCDL